MKAQRVYQYLFSKRGQLPHCTPVVWLSGLNIFYLFHLTKPCVYTSIQKYRKTPCCFHIFQNTIGFPCSTDSSGCLREASQGLKPQQLHCIVMTFDLVSSPGYWLKEFPTTCLTYTIVLLEWYSWTLRVTTKSRFHMPNITCHQLVINLFSSL